MSKNVTLISGTDFNISDINILGTFNNKYKAEVVMFNKFGYIGLVVYGKDKIVRRHISDCEDIRAMIIGSQVRNLVMCDNRWVVVHDGTPLPSKEVYVVRNNDNYIARSNVNGNYTKDITKAWFTFNKEQSIRYANNMTISSLRAYESINVESVIELQHYV